MFILTFYSRGVVVKRAKMKYEVKTWREAVKMSKSFLVLFWVNSTFKATVSSTLLLQDQNAFKSPVQFCKIDLTKNQAFKLTEK